MVSVVVPIYNEEEIVVRFHEAVSNALKGAVDDWEVVYVNDGSTDSSLDLLKQLQAEDPHVVVVELSRNWGHMGAITAGLQSACGRAVIRGIAEKYRRRHVRVRRAIARLRAI